MATGPELSQGGRWHKGAAGSGQPQPFQALLWCLREVVHSMSTAQWIFMVACLFLPYNGSQSFLVGVEGSPGPGSRKQSTSEWGHCLGPRLASLLSAKPTEKALALEEWTDAPCGKDDPALTLPRNSPSFLCEGCTEQPIQWVRCHCCTQLKLLHFPSHLGKQVVL